MQLAGMGLAAGSLLSGCAQKPTSDPVDSVSANGEFEQVPSDQTESYSGEAIQQATTSSESAAELHDKHVARIVLISDMHIDASFEPSIGHAQAAFAALTQFDPAPDVIVINGDIANHGLSEEFDLAESLAADAGLQFPTSFICAMGNHEQRGYYDEASPEAFAAQRELFMQRCGLERLYYDVEVNGIHIAVLGPDADPLSWKTIRLSNEQLEWLDDLLEADAQEERLTFVFSHQPINDTVIHTYEGEYAHDALESSDALHDVVAKYPHAVVVTAHTHSPADFFLPNEDGPLYVADSAVAYLRHDPYVDWTDEGVNYSCGVLADVFGDRVEFLSWDFVQNTEDDAGGFTLEASF